MRKLLLLTPLALAACSDSEPREEPTPTPTVAQPRALASADFDLRTLGARIVGPQGPQVETVLSAGNREIAKMVSYVACPEEFDECNPGELPEGTLFTYVHEVTLAEEAADDSAAETAEGPEVVESPPTLFRTTERAHGSNFAVGYSNSQALEALGNEDAISITADDGRLIWRVVEGDGWAPGTTITFWWKSAQPPAGPADAYLLEVDGNQAIARGPFPAEEKRAEQTPAN
ncbi:hypothetical protein [Qipengyuania aquimaris]|uniref:hypothetical protein n=1 Tax=Qipengyuania aquimaris TaxID=255984 RepID=UPI001FD51974|nr:hypothetical protein [Qipengyuania aquimaris]UOR14951.1 hypothetical protein LCM05_10740 [Qipengyuania aquimaris]